MEVLKKCELLSKNTESYFQFGWAYLALGWGMDQSSEILNKNIMTHNLVSWVLSTIE